MVKVFASFSGRWYAYDSATNKIFLLDELSARIASCWSQRRWARLSRLREQAGESAIAARAEALAALLRTGEGSRPRLMYPPASREELHSLLAHRLRQAVLVITERCNLRCRYCIYSGQFPQYRIHSERRMPWEVARAAIDLLVRCSDQVPSLHLGFYGGEPLLEPELIKSCVRYIRQKAPGRPVSFHLTTNGTFLSEANIRLLAEHDFFLTVSLDGPRQMHDAGRVFANGRGSWSCVSEGLERIRKIAPEYFGRRVYINCVVGPGTDLRRLVEFFGDPSQCAHGLDVTFSGMQTVERVAGEQARERGRRRIRNFTTLREQFIEELASGRLHEARLLRSLFLPGLYRIHTRRKLPVEPGVCAALGQCVPGVKEFAVDPAGQLHACVNMPQGLPLGDVWRGFDADRVYEVLASFCRSLLPKCRNCWAVRLCGICLVSLGPDWQTAKGPPAARCREERRSIAQSLRMYATILERQPRALDLLGLPEVPA